MVLKGDATAMVNITINGQQISAHAGMTILKAAKQAGIDIPTLCEHPALNSVGACRMCLVEIQGQRNLQTACTFPITEGMDIQTESPRVVSARKLILDLLFSERNHYCMICEMSGDCELQNLGYRYGLDHWLYQTYTKSFPLDASHKYYLMDHNRCVLCGRCIRACGDKVANHTLGLRLRGADTMVHADGHIPLKDSTCISCGSCVQVCPTGALVDKRSAFMGRNIQTEHIVSTCGQCSIGCGMTIVTRGGNVLRIDSDWNAEVNGGLLCKYGRFEPLYNERQRIETPMIRAEKGLEPASWEEALKTVAEHMGGVKEKDLGILTSTNATNEALYLVDQLFRQELKAGNVGILNDCVPRPFDKASGTLADIEGSDLILLVGVDPAKDQPVASYPVKRAIDKGVRLIVVDDKDNGLTPFATMSLSMSDIKKGVDIAERAEHPVIAYGTGITEAAVNALKKISKKASFIAIEPGFNTYAAVAYGLNNGFKPSSAKFLYILIGEQNWTDDELLKKIPKSAFVVVQASFKSPLTDRADVALPMATWSEREGSLTNTEGRLLKLSKAVEPRGEAKPDWEVLSLLAYKMGKKLGSSLKEISSRANKQFK